MGAGQSWPVKQDTSKGLDHPNLSTINNMKTALSLLALSVLVALAAAKPQQSKSNDEYMAIYTKCRQVFGTSPSVECR